MYTTPTLAASNEYIHMLAAIVVSALIAAAVSYRRHYTALAAQPKRRTVDVARRPVVTDVLICHHPLMSACNCRQRPEIEVIKKDLTLYQHPDGLAAWLRVEVVDEAQLGDEDQVVTSVVIGKQPSDPPLGAVWERRQGGIWLLKQDFRGQIDRAVTGIDVLYGADAVDPRLPEWNLLQTPLQLAAAGHIPVARLSIRHGRAKPSPDRKMLRISEDGIFRILQISDLHMAIDRGICKDAMDKSGNYLGPVEADPRTVGFMEEMLDSRKPDLVVLTGDLVRENIQDSQTALFKAVAPMEARGIPYATVFGNHDSEGTYALSRTEQMALLRTLPNCLSKPGPVDVDGVGNYMIRVLEAAPSTLPALTLYLLDSHGIVPGVLGRVLRKCRHRYEHIKQSQIKWFTETFESQQREREQISNDNVPCVSLAFQHIPLPEFKDCDSDILTGSRGEPTEGPFYNSYFYDALAIKGVAVIATGHDHVNDFVARLHQAGQPDAPFLCSGGSAGFNAYGQYGNVRTYRRARCFDFDAKSRTLTTWMHVEYRSDKVDQLQIVKGGVLLGSQQQSG